MGKTGRRELGDHVMHTCPHTMPEPTAVFTMTSTSIKAVKLLQATMRPKNLVMPPYRHAGKSRVPDFSIAILYRRALIISDL